MDISYTNNDEPSILEDQIQINNKTNEYSNIINLKLKQLKLLNTETNEFFGKLKSNLNLLHDNFIGKIRNYKENLKNIKIKFKVNTNNNQLDKFEKEYKAKLKSIDYLKLLIEEIYAQNINKKFENLNKNLNSNSKEIDKFLISKKSLKNDKNFIFAKKNSIKLKNEKNYFDKYTDLLTIKNTKKFNTQKFNSVKRSKDNKLHIFDSFRKDFKFNIN